MPGLLASLFATITGEPEVFGRRELGRPTCMMGSTKFVAEKDLDFLASMQHEKPFWVSSQVETSKRNPFITTNLGARFLLIWSRPEMLLSHSRFPRTRSSGGHQTGGLVPTTTIQPCRRVAAGQRFAGCVRADASARLRMLQNQAASSSPRYHSVVSIPASRTRGSRTAGVPRRSARLIAQNARRRLQGHRGCSAAGRNPRSAEMLSLTLFRREVTIRQKGISISTSINHPKGLG